MGGSSRPLPSSAVVGHRVVTGTVGPQQGAADEIRRHVAAHAVDVLLVFEDDAERIVDGLLVEIDRAEGQQCPRPVERLGHARRLEEIDAAQTLGEGDDLPRQALRRFRHARLKDAELLVIIREVDPVVEAAPLERVVDLARTVRGEDHHRDVLGADRADLGHGHLEVGEELQEKRLQLLIGAVDLVDEEHGSPFVGGVDRLQQRPLEEELLGEEIVANRLPALAAGRFDRAQIEHLARIIPLVDRRRRVEAFVALEADQRRLRARPRGPWRFRSCRRRPRPPAAAACRVSGSERGSSPDRARPRSADRGDRAPAHRR